MSKDAQGGASAVRNDTSEWLARHGAALRRYFRRRVDPCDVDDLVQDVLVKLHKATIASDMAGAERYLFTIARNVLLSRHRHADASDLRELEQYSRIVLIDDPLSPERIVIAKDEYDQVRQAILRLPPRSRAAFLFSRFENLSYSQIAVKMHISRDTVKELMARAIKGLERDLAGDSDHD